jgi:hypothetical protein
MTREEFLLEGVKYYTEDTNRRCASTQEGCFYSPKKAGKGGISKGCMIGYHLDACLQEKLDNLDKEDMDLEGTGVDEKEIFKLLPDWMKELGQDFLIDTQSLHDKAQNWGVNELTWVGKIQLSNIIENYGLEKEVFKDHII